MCSAVSLVISKTYNYISRRLIQICCTFSKILGLYIFKYFKNHKTNNNCIHTDYDYKTNRGVTVIAKVKQRIY